MDDEITPAATEETAGSAATDAGGDATQTEAERAAAALDAAHQREIDRYRNEKGHAEKRAREAEARLREIEDAKKTETERVADRLREADEQKEELERLKAENEALTEALSATVERQKKALPADFRDLIPEGSPIAQLEWLDKAAPKLAKATGLPPSGGRAPGSGERPPVTPEDRTRHQQHYARRF